MIKHSPAMRLVCPSGHWAQSIYFDEQPPTQCVLCKAFLRREVMVNAVKDKEVA